MVIEVRLYATLRAIAGERSVAVSDDCSTVRCVVDELISRWPDLDERLYEDRELRPYIALIVDGRDIRHLDGLATSISAGTEIDLFPPVAGGYVNERSVGLRGLPEWLIRKYLVELGAHESFSPTEDGGSMAGENWSVCWTKRKAPMPGGFHGGLTEFSMEFEGPEEIVGPLFDAFMAKARRGGG